MRSHVLTAAAGLGLSLLASGLVWWYTGTLLVFLVVPFVPFLFRWRRESGREVQTRECPRCGFETADAEYRYCPRDGARLDRRDR